MSEKRKDSKGRILKDGEGQRKNGTYDYRYIDIYGKRKSVYAATLNELREKEAKIRKDLSDGMDSSDGDITVIELIDLYISQKQGVRNTTRCGYQTVYNIMDKERFGHRRISSIKPSEAKSFIIKLKNDGRSFGTISIIKNVLKPAFNIAVDDNRIRRNPFDFYLSTVISNDAEKRKALTKEQKEVYLNFIKSDKLMAKYLDEIIILLGTGLRVSELYGLTLSDIDFENRRIKVDKQLLKRWQNKYHVNKPKSKSGERYIPIISEEVYSAFERAVKNRIKPEVEIEIDGYSGFLFLNEQRNPKTAGNLEKAMRRIIHVYNDTHEEKLPIITPHILRHTFCTELAMSDINVKSLQYLMGHSDIYTTLNIYTDANYASAKEALEKLAIMK